MITGKYTGYMVKLCIVRAAKQRAKAWCFLLMMEVILLSLVSY